jgi:hypothetical protein
MSFYTEWLKRSSKFNSYSQNPQNPQKGKNEGQKVGFEDIEDFENKEKIEKAKNRIAEESSGSPPQQKAGQAWKCYAVCSYFTYTPSYEAGICSVDGGEVEILKNCKWGYVRYGKRDKKS